MKSLVVFLTHDFKPIFRETLRKLELSLDNSMDAVVLFDSSKQIPEDINLGKIALHKCFRRPSPFDPIGQAHNFYLDFFRKNPLFIESYDYIWILENDVYYHGNIREFFDIHAQYAQDLLVPEFGLRHKNWCWLNNTKGMNIQPIGVTAVIYRCSCRMMRLLVGNANDSIVGHMEVVLPHLCLDQNFTIQQFIPDHMSCVNTFRSPMIDLIESDIKNKTSFHIQNKLYHPIKL